jgi:hypothetical protein
MGIQGATGAERRDAGVDDNGRSAGVFGGYTPVSEFKAAKVRVAYINTYLQRQTLL